MRARVGNYFCQHLFEQAGPSKLQKAALLRTKLISEDELLDLIREKTGIKEDTTEKTNSGMEIRRDTTLDTRSKTSFDANLDIRLNTKREKGEKKQKNLDTRLNREEKTWEENLDKNLEEEEETTWEEREKRQLLNFISREARQLGLEVKIRLSFFCLCTAFCNHLCNYRKIHCFFSL